MGSQGSEYDQSGLAQKIPVFPCQLGSVQAANVSLPWTVESLSPAKSYVRD